MDTYFWRYTHPRDGRVTKKDHVTEAEALRIFPEPERVEGSQVVAESSGHVAWPFASGLLRREDRAMVQAGDLRVERPGS